MGTIRMVMLDGLAVGDLLALRSGGFFEGAVVQLPAGVTLTPAPVVVAPAVPVPVMAPAAPAPRPVLVPVPAAPPLPSAPASEAALLAELQREAAEYRAEKAAPMAQAAPPEVVTEAAATSEPVAAPTVSTAGLPTVAQLSTCTKLRDVLQLLLDGGMVADDLAGYLETVKAEVPLLQRISNISERVSRTLSVMGQGC